MSCHRRQRQIDPEGAPLTGFAGDGDEAVVLFDDAVDDGETQPGPLAHLFGGKERFEDTLLRGLVHARPGVRDGQERKETGLSVPMGRDKVFMQFRLFRLQDELPPVEHDIPGVDRQVHQHLFQLVAVGKNRQGEVMGDQFQGDVFANDPVQEFFHLADDVVQVDGTALALLFATEEQQFSGEMGGTLRRFENSADVAAMRVIFHHLH